MSYYAVRSGRRPGVYYSWDECKKQVNGFRNARYKKFPTYEQAQHFIDGSDYPSRTSYQQERSAVVYTDGSYSHNGRYEAQAGIGFHWGLGHTLNVSESLYGRQTNQRAEIEVASRAVEQVLDNNITSLNVCTDSQFTMKVKSPNVLNLGMTEWIPAWKTNGSNILYGEEVVNKEEFEMLDNLCKELDDKLAHVPGHCDSPGNKMAVRLARKRARK